MLRQILHAGNYLDWISPLKAYIQDIAEGPSHTFLIAEECGWSALGIQKLLEQYGIKVWGVMFDGDTIMLTVRQEQALWAQYHLQKLGLPILSRPVAGSESARPWWASRARGSKSSSLFDWFFDQLGL